jgi:hypothetical protein
MSRVLLALAILLVATLAAPLSVSSGQQEVKLHPKAPVTIAAGSPISARVKSKDLAASAGVVCIEFQFEGDMLDPAESILIDLGPSLGAFGATNVSGVSEASRVLCTAQAEQLAAFVDGRESVEIMMEGPGSVTVTGATILVGP